MSTNQQLTNHTQRPHVTLSAIRNALQNFRGDISRRAALRRQTIRTGTALGKAKVGNLELPIVAGTLQQQILGLQIAVGNLLAVAVRQRLEQRPAHVARLLLVVVLLGHDAIEQLPAAHLFGDQVVVLRFVKDVVQADDVRMLEFLEDIDLILEGQLVLLGELGLGHDLDGKGAAGLFVRSLLDDREGTLAELRAYEIPSRGEGETSAQRHAELWYAKRNTSRYYVSAYSWK